MAEPVIVVGAGIAGVTAAYFLAREGVPVTVLDKAGVASHQSSRNWGFVRRQGCDPAEAELAQSAALSWQRLASEIGPGLTLVKRGLVNVAADEAQAEAYRVWLAAAGAEQAFGTQLLSADDVRALLPFLAGEWAGGMFTPTDGHAEPATATGEIAAAAAAAGARVEPGTRVLSISVRGGRVTGVLTPQGARPAGTVVCAAGAWSSRLLRPLGVRLPIRWIRATAARTVPAPALTDLAVATPGVGFSQAADGSVTFGSAAWSDYDIALDTLGDLRLFVPNFMRNRRMIRLHLNRVLAQDLCRRLPAPLRRGEPFEWPRMDDPPPNVKKIRGAHATLQRVVPALRGTGIARMWAGTVDITPDALPVIGPAGVDGLLLATGLSSHGFGIGPGVGRAVAELIAGGAAGIDLAPFRVERFAEARVRAHHHL